MFYIWVDFCNRVRDCDRGEHGQVAVRAKRQTPLDSGWRASRHLISLFATFLYGSDYRPVFIGRYLHAALASLSLFSTSICLLCRFVLFCLLLFFRGGGGLGLFVFLFCFVLNKLLIVPDFPRPIFAVCVFPPPNPTLPPLP